MALHATMWISQAKYVYWYNTSLAVMEVANCFLIG